MSHLENYMKDLERVQRVSLKMRETNDCGVYALALTTNGDYAEAHRELERSGRKPRKGTWVHMMRSAAPRIGGGFEVHHAQRPRKANGSRYTAKTIAKACPSGIWIVEYRGHVAAMVEGVILDWTDGRKHQVLNVYRVTRKGRNI